MIFRICEENEQVLYRRNVVCLEDVNMREETSGAVFYAVYYDSLGREYHLGHVSIVLADMDQGDIRDYLPKEFVQLPERFGSLGRDESYYENIKGLGDHCREMLLRRLRDLAFSKQWPDADSPIWQAMLRGVDPNIKRALDKVRGQFCRMAHGHARLTEYHFRYTAPQPEERLIPPASMEFHVFPASKPPTNIHALIGRNGSGKTYLIKHMVRCLQEEDGSHGEFTFFDRSGETVPMSFANVVCIAFSPFDNFAELINDQAALPSRFIGLEKEKGDLLGEIRKQFMEHFRNCLVTPRKRALWRRAIETLKSDPTFERERIDLFMEEDSLTGDGRLSAEQEERIIGKFTQMSSGHKVVLLIVTGCVAEVEERTIVFLDEPENHLHPPLLSALIRALSDLLTDRNGVAIVSTHSPVVLQEIPQSSVYLLTRYGDAYVKPERLERETFGTSLGSLIDDAFGFEVTASGFHKMIAADAERYESFDEVLDLYDGQLGNEAGVLLRMMMSKKRWAVD